MGLWRNILKLMTDEEDKIVRTKAAAYMRQYRSTRRAHVNLLARRWYAANREKELERHRLFRELHPEAIQAYNKRIWSERREHEQARMKRRRAEDPRVRERGLASNRRWRQENTEKARECNLKGGAKFREANREAVREYARQWYRDHLETIRKRKIVSARNRAAKKKAAGGKHTLEDVMRMYDAQNGKCAACKKDFPALGKSRFEVDHIIPLKPRDGSAPGSNGPENLQLLCLRCNRTKHNMMPDQWAEKLADLLKRAA